MLLMWAGGFVAAGTQRLMPSYTFQYFDYPAGFTEYERVSCYVPAPSRARGNPASARLNINESWRSGGSVWRRLIRAVCAARHRRGSLVRGLRGGGGGGGGGVGRSSRCNTTVFSVDSTRAQRPVAQHIPLARYFSLVGGAMLALLLILDQFFQKSPSRSKQGKLISSAPSGGIGRIAVYDTDRRRAVRLGLSARRQTCLPVTVADDSAAAREREAFAQRHPTAPNHLRPSAPRSR